MNLSLNEFQALIKKAARGAGFDWGSASEIARAVRRADSLNVDDLVACLQWHAEASEPLGPANLSGVWMPAGECMSPLNAGLCLAECADALPEQIKGVRYPQLLAGFVSLLNLSRSQPVGLIVHHDTVSFVSVSNHASHPGRPQLTDQQHSALDALAARTYAPATEQSRQAGAGAGLSDND